MDSLGQANMIPIKCSAKVDCCLVREVYIADIWMDLIPLGIYVQYSSKAENKQRIKRSTTFHHKTFVEFRNGSTDSSSYS